MSRGWRTAARVGSRRGLVVGVTALILAACTGGGPGDVGPTQQRSPAAVVPSLPARPVSHPTVWLCRPGLVDNPCVGGLDATVITRDGGRQVQPFTAAADPPVDCFYVYPTVSEADQVSAPLAVAPELVRTVRAQAARFTQACRLFAPVYRQISRQGLVTGGLTDPEARALAYGDVLSAFNDYVNADHGGRPFVLIGHSQGSWYLTQLIQQQIDGNPRLRARMLSALLLGGTVTTLPGAPAGGSFVNVATCRSAGESGCVVAYSTYPGRPPANGVFGRSTAERQAVCVSPAALLGRDELTAYLPTARIMGGPPQTDDPSETGFVTLPGRVTGTCRSTEAFTWLDVTIDRSGLQDAAQPSQGPAWGLHTADVSLALGDLVDLVAAQAAAWSERGGASQP